MVIDFKGRDTGMNTVKELAILYDIRSTVLKELNITNLNTDNPMIQYLNNRIAQLEANVSLDIKVK